MYFRIHFKTFDICKPLLLYFYAVVMIQNKNLIHSFIHEGGKLEKSDALPSKK